MPISDHSDFVLKAVKEHLGLDIEVRILNRNDGRAALEFWFKDLDKDEGPVFRLSPKGLRKHEITLKFGQYSQPLIEQIQGADAAVYKLAVALIKKINEKYELVIVPEQDLNNLQITKDFKLTSVISCEEAYDNLSSIDRTVGEALMPVIAAFMELIGYDDNTIEAPGDEEGEITQAFVTSRERKKTNRVMCIALHGNKCGVCGFEPSNFYSDKVNGIIEVHHIEPLSELNAPRIYDPLKDLIPLCPNCHRAIHKSVPALSLDELRDNILRK
ncbi:HNH endonuclease [Verrucomicrobia bacterium]|nr:HNH endonuclease [Verrucomicrobiota bacterium]